MEVADEAQRQGLRDVRWPGRFQCVDERIVLDGCHNPHAAEHLLATWMEEYGPQQATVIFGALGDKDYATMLEILEPICREVLFVPVRNERSADPRALAAACTVPHRIFRSVREALDASRGRILITGSLFLVGEALQALGVDL